MTNEIVRTIELNSPVSRVWRAITDHREFGQWFRVNLDGPFIPGEKSTGQITYPGYEHLKWEATVDTMKPESLFAYRWCPYGGEPEIDYSKEPTTLVEFRLEASGKGTRLTIRESGFDALPDDTRRIDALRSNAQGWTEQVEHITAHMAN